MKQHILLIDDDKDELIIFMDALKELPYEDGYKCTYASSPSQAMDMLKYLIPDFIFVDMNMPGMSGIEVLTALRRQKRLDQSKVYLYSNKIDDKIAENVMSTGATGCIPKTSSIHELREELTSVLVPRSEMAYLPHQ